MGAGGLTCCQLLEPTFSGLSQCLELVLPFMTPSPSTGDALPPGPLGTEPGQLAFPGGRSHAAGTLSLSRQALGGRPSRSLRPASCACLRTSQGPSIYLKGPPSGQVSSHCEHSRRAPRPNQPRKHLPYHHPPS